MFKVKESIHDVIEIGSLVQLRNGHYAMCFTYYDDDAGEYIDCLSGTEDWFPLASFDNDGKFVKLMVNDNEAVCNFRDPTVDIMKICGDATSPMFASRIEKDDEDGRPLLWERPADDKAGEDEIGGSIEDTIAFFKWMLT